MVAPATAQPDVSPPFRGFDRNRDGAITLEEMTAASDERLKRMDRNGDGAITRAEFDAYHASEARQRADRIFRALDRNRDGRITANEARNSREQRLMRCDFDKKGSVSRAEYLECQKRLTDRWGDRIFKSLDANGDGTIARAERLAVLRERFRKLDANSDGKVTREEFAEAHSRYLAKRGTSGSTGEPGRKPADNRAGSNRIPEAAAPATPPGTAGNADIDELD
jgi:Ca2+-binding EF-hand superfamily protein